MKKVAFVAPWYGEKIPGGAEMAMRDITNHLNSAGIVIEILSTCVKEFLADWNVNYYKPGLTHENGITVRRFPVRKRDVVAFDKVNLKLMNNILPLTDDEEETYLKEMINSPELYKYIREHKDEYQCFVFIPYMFGTTYWGVQECYEKAVMIPCFHDEAYIYMRSFIDTFSKVAGMLFNAQPEYDLTNKVYNLTNVNTEVMGLGVETNINFDANRFREKYGIKDKFILYAGRKDVGKNIYTLLDYFNEYKYRYNQSDLKLVLIGGGEVNIPAEIKDDVYDLGFVDIQDKYDAYAAAELLCQPSKNESFSYVIMESWICGKPVLVHEDCNVTSYFAKTSNAGLWFKNYFEFEGAVDFILENEKEANIMGANGRDFVMKNFDWNVIVDKYINYFKLFDKDDSNENMKLCQ